MYFLKNDDQNISFQKIKDKTKISKTSNDYSIIKFFHKIFELTSIIILYVKFILLKTEIITRIIPYKIVIYMNVIQLLEIKI